jgi:hypothetical protein
MTTFSGRIFSVRLDGVSSGSSQPPEFQSCVAGESYFLMEVSVGIFNAVSIMGMAFQGKILSKWDALFIWLGVTIHQNASIDRLAGWFGS